VALFIGIDLGSSSVKCAAVDHLGVIKAQAERSYDFDRPRDGWLEVDPEKWWEITHAVLADTVRNIDARQLKSISSCGVMMMAVMLDSNGRAVRPTLSWLDQRVLPQLKWIRDNHFEQAIFEATGTAISPSQTVLPLLWVKEKESESFGRIDKVILSKDYIRYKLTGNIHTDLTDASATLLLDNRTAIWNCEIADLLGLPQHFLPNLVSSTQVTGQCYPVIRQPQDYPKKLTERRRYAYRHRPCQARKQIACCCLSQRGYIPSPKKPYHQQWRDHKSPSQRWGTATRCHRYYHQ
jgi:xylulokinase